MLHHPVDGEEEAEDDDEARDESETARAVYERERGGEVDDEPRELYEHYARRVRVEREAARGVGRGKSGGVGRCAAGQQQL